MSQQNINNSNSLPAIFIDQNNNSKNNQELQMDSKFQARQEKFIQDENF